MIESVSAKNLKKELARQNNTEGFNYPSEYNLKLPIIRRCKICGKLHFSRRVSVFDKGLVCICENCGARSSAPMSKIVSAMRLWKLTIALPLIACLVLGAASAIKRYKPVIEPRVHIPDTTAAATPATTASSEPTTAYTTQPLAEESTAATTTAPPTTAAPVTETAPVYVPTEYVPPVKYVFTGSNYLSMDYDEESYVFSPPYTGDYWFYSDSDPADYKATLYHDGSEIASSDDFLLDKSRDFSFTCYCYAGENYSLTVKDFSSDYSPCIYIYSVTSDFINAFSDLKYAIANGLYLTSSDTTYDFDPSFDSSTATFTQDGYKTVIDYYIDDYNCIIWYGLSASRSSIGDFTAWYPVYY